MLKATACVIKENGASWVWSDENLSPICREEEKSVEQKKKDMWRWG